MFTARSVARATLRRSFSTAPKGKTVAVLGASGGIGQPLSLLLKNTDAVGQLNLFDVVNTPGVAADLGHMNTPAQVRGFVGMTHIEEALEGIDIAIIPAGVPRKPGMTRDDLFNTNANIVKDLAGAIAKVAPKAMVLAIINPLNSAVPIIAEVFKKAGVYDPKRVFGVTTLDTVRASTFVSKFHGWNPHDTKVTVIGGHAGTTIIPLLSQVPNHRFSDEDIANLTKRIQFGGDEVVKAKDGRGSATLSMAYAGAHFAKRLMDGMNGVPDVVECTYCANNLTEAPFFAAPVTLGLNGAEKVHSFGKLSAVEQANLDAMLPDLLKQINKGIAYAKK